MTYPTAPVGGPQPAEEYPFVDVSGQFTTLMTGPTADNDGDLD